MGPQRHFTSLLTRENRTHGESHEMFFLNVLRTILILILLSWCNASLGQHRKIDVQQNQDKLSPDLRTKTSKPSADSKAGPASKRPADIESLISDTYSVPAEFAVDALVRIAESKKVSELAWKKEILEEAFHRSAGAQQPVRRTSAMLPKFPVDTSAGYLSYAFDRKMDVLSLRTRVIKAMLELDKPRARAWFEEIAPKLRLSPLSCEDALVYNVSEYYELLGEIAQNTFSQEEQQQGAHIRLVQTYIDGISSSAQIAPLLKVIVSINTSREELSFLVQEFTKALGQTGTDDRSFTDSIASNDLTRTVYQLQQLLERRELYLSKNVLEAYRNYLSKNISGPRCAENAVTDKSKLPQYLRVANNVLLSVKPLTFDEIKQREISGSAKLHEYWVTADAQTLLAQYKDLRFSQKTGVVRNDSDRENSSDAASDDEDSKSTTETEKESVQWQLKFSQFLSGLERWSGANEQSKLSWFHQRQVLYQGLLEVAPRGPMRSEALRGLVSSLNDGEVETLSRIEWYFYVYHLLQVARTLEPKTRNEVLELMIATNHRALSMYAKLAKLNI